MNDLGQLRKLVYLDADSIPICEKMLFCTLPRNKHNITGRNNGALLYYYIRSPEFTWIQFIYEIP